MKRAVLGLWWMVGLGWVLASVGGCGRPATAEECHEIVEQMARLQAASAYPGRPDRIDEEVKKAKSDPVLRERAAKECVGHPITDRALRCIRAAKTPQEIVDTCLR
jgi:hypothetical protein